MAKAKTVDNLGIETYTRYAEDQQLLDEKLVKEGRAIPAQTEIDVTSPSYTSEFELLFETRKRNLPWADFFPPPKFLEQKKRLFTHQIIPSMGSEEKKEALSQRLVEVVALAHRKKEVGKWGLEDQRELEAEEREKNLLLALIKHVSTLDKVLIDINARRGQYQKG